jgi:hypothetical protein
MEPRAS